MRAFEYIVYVLQDLNYLLFIAAIFGLKKIQTYMDSRNDTKEKIKASLLRLRRIATMFLVISFLLKVLEYLGITQIKSRFSLTPEYGWINLIYNIFYLLFSTCAHIYLLVTVFSMQSLFRKFGHVKGYFAEVYVLTLYLAFWGYLGYWYLLKPFMVWRINTTDYICSEPMRKAIAVFVLW